MLLDIWEFILFSQGFKCSTDQAKRSFYTAANAIFGKIGRLASDEVTLHQLKTKCVPVLLYGLEALPWISHKYPLLTLSLIDSSWNYSIQIILKLSSHVSSSYVSFLSASLYFSKRCAYWDRLCRDVVGWLSRACTVAKRCILGL